MNSGFVYSCPRVTGRIRRSRWNLLILGVAAAALILGATGCSSSGGSNKNATVTPTAGSTATEGTVAVSLVDYKIAAEPASVSAGSITFNVRNIGGTKHEMVVLQTDLDPTALPTKADGSADEEGAGVKVVDEVAEFDPGLQKSLTVDLTPGKYVLICNTVQESNGQTISHYARGMTLAFTVTP